MKSPSANQLYEYSQKCGEDGHEHLQKIMLIESANLGYWKAVDLAKHEGIEVRRLARYGNKNEWNSAYMFNDKAITYEQRRDEAEKRYYEYKRKRESGEIE